MQTRHLFIAVATAALLAGSSYGALAGQHSNSMCKCTGASSFSMIDAQASVRWGKPQAEVFGITKTQANGNSVGSGGSSGIAAAGTLSIGLDPVGESITQFVGGGGSAALAAGSTGGLSCSGSGCGTSTSVSTNFNTSLGLGGGGGRGGRR